MDKKAEGLSLSVIVIAVLCLIVLVIMILIFTGKIGEFTTGIDSCPGKCVANPVECEDGHQPVYKAKCKGTSGSGNYCCLKTEADKPAEEPTD